MPAKIFPPLIPFDTNPALQIGTHTNIVVDLFLKTFPYLLVREVNMATLWDTVKQQIRTRLPHNSFSLWIDPITLLEEKGGTLFLGCPNKFSLKWVTENYLASLQEVVRQKANGDYRLALKVAPPSKSSPNPPFAESKQLVLPNIPAPSRNGSRRLNHEFTFDRFVVGKCNEFAYSASKAMAFEPNLPYPSLFILASTGLGKSHLSQATAHAIWKNNPKLKVFYITAEDFINEMIHALRTKQIDAFKNKYRRSCDVLLLEEVHFLSNKEKTQAELGYTLDALASDGKRLVFTSSLLPKDIPNLTKPLSSRLTSGIITTLEKPGYETRLKIIRKKAAEQSLSLSDEIVDVLARNLTGDIRQIESALRCLKAKSELMRVKIDRHLAKEVLQCHVPGQSPVTVERIRRLVCQYFKIDPLTLRSKSRKQVHVYPRSVFVYLCRQHTDVTVEEIGQSLNRNHSTVLYASEVIEHKMKVDHKVRNQVSFLSEKLLDMQT
jgi:chromosomal replication initiator protein